MSFGHRGRDRMIKELNRRHTNIIQNDKKLFVSVCELCQQKRSMGKKDIMVKPKVLSYLNS